LQRDFADIRNILSQPAKAIKRVAWTERQRHAERPHVASAVRAFARREPGYAGLDDDHLGTLMLHGAPSTPSP
jgi:hypothetical protein